MSAMPKPDESGHAIEQGVIGALLMDNAAFDLAQPLSPAHFLDRSHAAIYGAIAALVPEADPITVSAHLGASGPPLAELLKLEQCVPSVRNVGLHARLLRAAAAKREALALLSKASSDIAATDDLAGALRALQADAAAIDAGGDESHHLLRFVDTELDQVRAPAFVLDNLIQEGVVLLAGAPGVGKTTCLLPLICRAAWLCRPDDPLRPILRRRIVWITEDVQQARRVLYAYLAFGGSGCTQAEVDEWFRLVEAKRGAPDEFVRAKPGMLKLSNPMQRADGSSLTVHPLAVLDTKSAIIDLENENDNAEASKAIATLKQGYELPVLMLGHTAKALSKAEAKDLSSRGAGSNEGDTHQSLYFVADEASKLRYLYLGKRRFETETTEVEFRSQTHYVDALDPLGNPVQMPVRTSEPRLLKADERATERKQAAEAQAEAEAVERQREMRGELLDRAAAAVASGNPLSERSLRDAVSGNTADVAGYIEALKSESWLVLVDVPKTMIRVNNAKKAFVIALDAEERRTFLKSGELPASKTAIPPSWGRPKPAKDSIPVVPAGTSETAPKPPREGSIPLVPDPLVPLKEKTAGTTGKADAAFPGWSPSQTAKEPPGTSGNHREPANP